ncbi:membrane alanyl aminopeptidase-like [Bicyclus anynana]|uniref:Aminopeptidase n=1 Tax=Bicyclus anynana TaxID=110368 RepID=A0ABM3LNX1_BICAN|nr:membrane alanyl aminopeptidase-like [Bicyclus anynana]
MSKVPITTFNDEGRKLQPVIVTALYPLLVSVNGDDPFWINEIEEVLDIDRTVSRNTDSQYRLPTNVVPLEYDIYIDLYFDERPDRPFSYDGRETIIIEAEEENVMTIVTHANVDSISVVQLTDNNGNALNVNFMTEPQYHFLKINLQQPLVVGTNYSLYIEYNKKMNEGPLKRGIWRGWYVDDEGIERTYAATHFQPYNARQAFPCWDEPLFKAYFKLHLSRPASYNGMFSNTGIERSENIGNNRIRDHFLTTPRMSSYLVTFLVSESFRVIASNNTFDPPIRIIGRSNAGLGRHALQLCVGMTEYFDEYFQIPYSKLHANLANDHIASPDWASAGTENWGMVSYRELHLMVDPRETIMSVEHYTTTLISHELAHKCYARKLPPYRQRRTAKRFSVPVRCCVETERGVNCLRTPNKVFPQYDLHEHFNSRYLQASLSFDSGLSTVPLNHEVNSPAQVTGHFGTISYSKGAAFLRMLADMITPATFRKACQYFLNDNMYEATDQYDLFRAFEKAVNEDGTLREYDNFNFEEFYRVWVNEPGYPLLTVNVDHGTGVISLSQERFFISPSAPPTEQIYPIPITYYMKSNETLKLKPSYMMSNKTLTIQKNPGAEWIIFNVLQHGHYRVTYDNATWNLISDALFNSPNTIHHLNRAQIVDDVFALMRSERMSYYFGFNILKFLRQETNYHVWNAAISGYSFFLNRFRQIHIYDKYGDFRNYVVNSMDTVIAAVGYDPKLGETVTESLLRQEVLNFACDRGHRGCMLDSEEKFNKMISDSRHWVDSRIRRHVYKMGVRGGYQEQFNFLMNRFKSSNIANDQLEMLRGLASTISPVLLTRYLEMTLDKVVRYHDKVTAFNYALLASTMETPHTLTMIHVFDFVKNNIDAIRKAYTEDSPPNPVHTILSNMASYMYEQQLEEYEDWLWSTQNNTAQFNTALSAIKNARNNIAWAEKNIDIIVDAVGDGPPPAILSSILLIAMFIFAIIA